MLPEAFAHDSDRLARFTREANTFAAPRWRTDGKERYFLAPDAAMMAVPVHDRGHLV